MPARVDAHHHLLFPEERDYRFLGYERYRPLARRYDSEVLRADLGDCGIERTVAVEANPSSEETERLLRAAAEDSLVAGVVGWVDLTGPAVREEIERLRESPGGSHLVGLRHNAHDEPDPGWLARPAVVAGLLQVAEAGLGFDLLVRPRELPAAAELADALPELRLVVDHLGKPRVTAAGGPLDEEWEEGLRSLAARPQVHCKVSGLVAEMVTGSPWTAAALRPYLERALEWFGPHRLMFGSDWPVCLLDATYAQVLALVVEFLEEELSPEEGAAVLGGVATSYYRINEEKR
ncbi:MAG TPA: amidohydrolase family protein [Solirubrobacterales bacterium]|nr:amidohydrolase family protein [Solirubrobacterales bacterium]